MTDLLPRLDIEIRLLKCEGSAYPAEITLGGEQVFRGTLPAEVRSITDDGRRLFDALFADATLRNAWAEARGRSLQRRLRLRIDPTAAELHALPWEKLVEGEVVLAAHDETPFSRYLPIGLPWGRPLTTRPVRALIVISNPADLHSKYDLPQADVALEEEILDEALSGIGANDLHVDYLDEPVTLERLEEALRRGYHLLHFLGHGAFNARREQAALYLQDADGNAQRVIDQDLAAMLARQGVQPHLVFLAACQSATRSLADAYLGLAPKLVAAGVPAVVAMQDTVTVASARKFSAAFYRRLLEHGCVDVAVNEARSTLLTAGRADAAVPVLFMRLTSGRLWDSAEDTPQTAATTPRIPPPPEPAPLPEMKNFIGREVELACYAQQLQNDHLAVITGSPHIGKSALAAQLARRSNVEATHSFWHEFHADEGLEEVGSRLAGFLYWLGQTDTWNLLNSTRLTGAQSLAPREMLDYAAQGLRGRGCLVVFDAWQKLSTDDQTILIRCVERLVSERTSVIITSHSTPSFSHPIDPLPLHGLTLAETEHLLAGQAVSVSPELKRELHERTAGNPQFLLLACDALRQTSDPERLIGRLAEADQVERFLMAEVDQGLSGEERRAMSGVAALLGYPGTRDAVEAALDTDGLRRLLSTLSGRHLLITSDGAHGKEYREVALLQSFYYGLLGRRERQPIHQRAGTYYERDEPEPLRAAQHFIQIDEYDRAAQLLTADVAALLNRGQAKTLRQVLDRIDLALLSPTRRVEIQLARGRVATHLSDVTAARHHYAAALREAHTLPPSSETQTVKASIYRWQADLLNRQGEYPASLEAVQSGLNALAGQAGSEAAELRLIAADTYNRLGDLDRTRAMAEEVRQWSEVAGQPTALARACNLIGVTDWRRGLYEASLEQYHHALELYRQTHNLIGEAKAYNWIGGAYFYQGRWAEAEQMFHEAYELATRIGDAYVAAGVGNNLGLILLQQGRLEEARTVYQTALDLLVATQGSLYVRATLQMNLAVAVLRQGAAVLACEHLRASLALFEQTQAREQLAQLHIHLAEAALALGDTATADQQAQQALALARELQQRDGEGVAQRVLGEIALIQKQFDVAEHWLQDSSRTLEAVKEEYEEARTQLVLAELYATTQHTREAQVALDRCERVFARLEATPWLARAARCRSDMLSASQQDTRELR